MARTGGGGAPRARGAPRAGTPLRPRRRRRPSGRRAGAPGGSRRAQRSALAGRPRGPACSGRSWPSSPGPPRSAWAASRGTGHPRGRDPPLTSRWAPPRARRRRPGQRLSANLVENAVRHSTPGGWVSAATDAVGGRARLTVRNSGPVAGVDAMPALFGPFRRSAGERTGRGGGPRSGDRRRCGHGPRRLDRRLRPGRRRPRGRGRPAG